MTASHAGCPRRDRLGTDHGGRRARTVLEALRVSRVPVRVQERAFAGALTITMRLTGRTMRDTLTLQTLLAQTRGT
jgi:hypothetical protein